MAAKITFTLNEQDCVDAARAQYRRRVTSWRKWRSALPILFGISGLFTYLSYLDAGDIESALYSGLVYFGLMGVVVGQKYRVSLSFVDYDRHTHKIGEIWTFLGSSFQPHDDGLSLFVSLDGASEWQIRLQWRSDEQGPVIDKLDKHIVRQP